MKSERAKIALEQLDCVFSLDGWLCFSDAHRIIEIAEKEVEEQMRQKAIEAHRKVCFFRNLKDNTCANTATQCGEHSCYYMNYIIQELTE